MQACLNVTLRKMGTSNRPLGERMIYILEAKQLGTAGQLRVERHLLHFLVISPASEVACG